MNCLAYGHGGMLPNEGCGFSTNVSIHLTMDSTILDEAWRIIANQFFLNFAHLLQQQKSIVQGDNKS
jgi:hypothetical protein